MTLPTGQTSAQNDEQSRLRTALLQWLGEHDPATLGLLQGHPHGPAILTRAAGVVVTSLAEGREILADPGAVATWTPEERDQAAFYLLPHPHGLETALVANMAGDQTYWQTQMRHAGSLDSPTE